MKGRNELILNTEQMTKIVQHYLSTVLFREGEDPLVTGIAEIDSGRFKILIDDSGGI